MILGANGIRINLTARGDGDPVFFVHAASMDWTQWEPQIAALRERFRCLAIDVRNHGRSDTTYGPMTLELLARDLRDVMDALDVERADIVGSALGATIAQQLALDAPERVGRLVLLSTWFRTAHMDWGARLRDPGTPSSARRELLDMLFAPVTRASRPEVIEQLQAVSESRDPLLALAFPGSARSSLDAHATRLATLEAKALILYGEEDLVASPREIAVQLAALVPDGRAVGVPGAAHFPNVENADFVNRAIVGFLGNDDPG